MILNLLGSLGSNHRTVASRILSSRISSKSLQSLRSLGTPWRHVCKYPRHLFLPFPLPFVPDPLDTTLPARDVCDADADLLPFLTTSSCLF